MKILEYEWKMLELLRMFRRNLFKFRFFRIKQFEEYFILFVFQCRRYNVWDKAQKSFIAAYAHFNVIRLTVSTTCMKLCHSNISCSLCSKNCVLLCVCVCVRFVRCTHTSTTHRFESIYIVCVRSGHCESECECIRICTSMVLSFARAIVCVLVFLYFTAFKFEATKHSQPYSIEQHLDSV